MYNAAAASVRVGNYISSHRKDLTSSPRAHGANALLRNSRPWALVGDGSSGTIGWFGTRSDQRRCPLSGPLCHRRQA